MFGSINIGMRRTDARLRRADAHNIKLYIYIYDDDGDGWIGWILDGEYVCLDGFLDGFGGVGMFFGSPRIDLMDVGCMLGRFLAGFVEGFRRIFDGCLMGL